MPLSAGERLGPYEILSPIGAGGMGEVYKARDTRLGRIVAVKVSKAAFSERFEREARAVASLNHSNICTLHDVGPNYLVMEYIEGTPLEGPDVCRAGVEVRRADLRCAGRRAPQGHHPSRSQAREHSRHQDRHQAAGFRPGETGNHGNEAGGPRPTTPLWPWRSPAGTRSWVRSTTCRPSSCRRRGPGGKSTRAATSSPSAWCCTSCSPASAPSRARRRPA